MKKINHERRSSEVLMRGADDPGAKTGSWTWQGKQRVVRAGVQREGKWGGGVGVVEREGICANTTVITGGGVWVINDPGTGIL